MGAEPMRRERDEVGMAERGRARLGHSATASTVMVVLAILLSLSSLLFAATRVNPDVIAPFAGIGSFAALLFYFSQVWVYLARHDHPVLEVAVLAGGAVMLAACAVWLAGRVPAAALVVCYWAPSLLALGAALLVLRAHRPAVRELRLPVNSPGRRRAARRP